MERLFLSTILLGGIFISIHTAAAFSVDDVDRSAFANNEAGVAAYQISFTLGSRYEELRIPVVGERGLQNGSRQNHFGYQIEARRPRTAVVDTGTSTALILSKAPIENGMYVIEPGKRYTFMMLGVYKIGLGAGNEYRLRLIELPFFMGEEKEPQHFTPSELKYFYTEAEDLYYDSDTLTPLN
jgi:hypothetical protein